MLAVETCHRENLATVCEDNFGMVNYGEKTWLLQSRSSDGFRESILPPPDPGPNYAKFLDDYIAKSLFLVSNYLLCTQKLDEMALKKSRLLVHMMSYMPRSMVQLMALQ
ncbi:unnamed protein product [Vicia faba]|uniref:DUF4220 domain-containing protein n=1 Tax=Vicia faba TaxID=3906 RepID=A0AAV1B822_VICFA|nr:unnamed protein product [Vicia faba]